MPAGRPTKYDPNFHPQSYIELSAQGKNKAQIAAAWETYRECIYNWAKQHPEFSDACKKGDELRQNWYLEKGHAMMDSGKGSPAIWMFLMKNMFRDDFNERREYTHQMESPKLIINMEGEDEE